MSRLDFGLKNMSSTEQVDANDTADSSFTPMGYSIIERDEASIIRTYNLPNTDVTLAGIEKSDISWLFPPGEVSLFKDIPPSNISIMKEGAPVRSVNTTHDVHRKQCNVISNGVIGNNDSILPLDKNNCTLANDTTLDGIDSSVIPWRFDGCDISLFQTKAAQQIEPSIKTKLNGVKERQYPFSNEIKPAQTALKFLEQWKLSSADLSPSELVDSFLSFGGGLEEEFFKDHRCNQTDMAAVHTQFLDQSSNNSTANNSETVPSIAEILAELKALPRDLSESVLADHFLNFKSTKKPR